MCCAIDSAVSQRSSVSHARTVEKEDAELGRAVGDIDERRGQEDAPVLDEDPTELVLDLVLGEAEALALHDRKEAEDDDGEDGRLDELVDSDLLERRDSERIGRRWKRGVEQQVERVVPDRRHRARRSAYCTATLWWLRQPGAAHSSVWTQLAVGRQAG